MANPLAKSKVTRPGRRAKRPSPPLRLVGAGQIPGPGVQRGAGPNVKALTATDPRWVLAVRVGEQLQGAVLTPERRQRLGRTGRMLGLTAFDCQLIIAIVQDQARRGHEPGYCATAGEAQLRMIPRPDHGEAWLTRRRAIRTALIVAAVVTVELALGWWLWLG